MPTTAQPYTVRPVAPADVPDLKAVIDGTGLFPSALLDGMLPRAFGGTADRGADSADGDALWLTVDLPVDLPTDDVGGALRPAAVAYVAPERLTSGTWNLYLIAVHPARQGRGVGAAVVRHVETALARRGARVLLVETSGLPEFARTRAFYRANGYTEEARIRAFYAAGEDKVVFWKALAGPGR